jgi:uncharacterized protein YqeY
MNIKRIDTNLSLLTQIEEDFKKAFKAKEETVKSALSNLKAALKNAEIEKKYTLSEPEIASVIGKKVKQHKDSITEFEKGGRPDLVENETKQMQVLQTYLPKQMDESQVRNLVTDTIHEMNATAADFGKVMKAVLAKAAGQTDGTVVSKIVKEELK